jgi:hypothetical protein
MQSIQLTSNNIEAFFLSFEGHGVFEVFQNIYVFIQRFLAEPWLGRVAADDRNLYCSYTFL